MRKNLFLNQRSTRTVSVNAYLLVLIGLVSALTLVLSWGAFHILDQLQPSSVELTYTYQFDPVKEGVVVTAFDLVDELSCLGIRGTEGSYQPTEIPCGEPTWLSLSTVLLLMRIGVTLSGFTVITLIVFWWYITRRNLE